jgi:tetratricopeptide (TPR) repeat protein
MAWLSRRKPGWRNRHHNKFSTRYTADTSIGPFHFFVAGARTLLAARRNRPIFTAMRRLIVGSMIAFGLVWPMAAGADQKDPRLDKLLAVLQTSSDPSELSAAHGEIWRLWIENDDQELFSLMEQGVVLMNRQRLDEALKVFDDLVDIAPDYAEAWNKRATVHFLLGNLADSIADVDTTLDLEPRHFGALSGLGQIQLRRGDAEAALSAFEAALRMHPHLPGARDIIRKLRRDLGRNSL